MSSLIIVLRMSVSVNNLFNGVLVLPVGSHDHRHTHPLLIVKIEATIWMDGWYPRATIWLVHLILLETVRLWKTRESSIKLSYIIQLQLTRGT
jgi:hypothetical protein